MKKIICLLVLLFGWSLNLDAQSTNCTTATNLSLNNGTVCVAGTSAGAVTDNILYGTCNSVPVNMVWYTYVTNGANNSFTVTPGTLTNAEIVIYQGGCPSTGTLQNCVTATGSAPIVTSWGMTAGIQVWIGIASNAGVSGTFNFCVNSQPPAASPGNTCSQAKAICSPTFNQPTIPSNSSGQSPACFLSAPQQDIWIKFTVTQNGQLKWTATPTNLTTEFDWALWNISSGCPGSVACCNYNYASGSSSGFGMQAQAGTVTCGSSALGSAANEFCGPMNVTCGQTYAIQISNYSNNNTGFSLSFAGSTAMINSNAAFSVGPSTLVCGSNLNATINNLSTGACGGLTWNFGDGSAPYVGTSPPAHNYTTPGTYAITATAGGLCPSTATQFVQLLAPLAATVTPSPVLCPGSCNGTATLAPITGGNGVYTYTWSTGSNATTVNSLCSGTYSVTISNAACGTSITKTVSIVAPPPLTLTAVTVSTSCGGSNGSVSVTATGGTSPYQYSINGGAFSATTNFTGLAGGNYTMAVKDNNACQTTTVVTVVAPAATPISATSATACANVPGVLTASGATTYSWSPSTGLSSTTGATVSATVGTTTTYTVTGTTGACSSTATAVMVINPSPTATPGNNSPVCEGQGFNLTGGGGLSYSWSGPGGFTSTNQNTAVAVASATNAGAYTLTVTDANTCTNTAVTNVTVNPLPVPTATNNGPTCSGTALVLNAGGGGTYQWSGPNGFTSSVQNPTIVPSTTINSGVYTVTVTLAGCTATQTTYVIVTTPTAAAGNTGPYCEGDVISLTGSAGTAHAWSGPLGFTSAVQNPNIINSTAGMSGTYTVIVSIGSCTAQASTSVTVNPKPVSVPNCTSPVCEGQSVTFTGLGGSTYQWSGPGAFSSANQNTVIAVASPSNSGTYSLIVVDANGCKDTAITSLVVNPLPVPTAANSGPVCSGTSLVLNAGGGGTYQWSGPNSFVSSAQSPTIAASSTVDAGIYTVTVTLAGCTATATTNVVVTTQAASAGNSGPYCAGSNISLNSSAGTAYSWSGPSGFTSATQNPVINNSTAGMSGTYSVIVSIGSCTAMATTSVTINPLPVAIANNNSPVCIGQDITFTGGGGVSYQWNGPLAYSDATPSPTITPAVLANSGAYTLTVTDANNCINSAVTNVTVNPLPNPVATGTSVCENGNATLLSGGGVTYSWSGPSGFSSSIQNPPITGATFANVGQYTVTVTDVNSCTNTAVADLTVNPAPTPTAANNSPICINNFLTLSGGGGVSYSWTGPNGFFSTAQNPSVTANTTAYSGNYSVTVTDIHGCFGVTSISVVINPLPVVNVTSGPNKGCAPLCVSFSVQSNPAAASCNWNFGNGSFSNTLNSSAGCYGTSGTFTMDVSITDVNGCPGSATRTVEVYPQPVADFNYSPLFPIVNVDGDVNFTDASYGAQIVSWNWYFMNTPQYQSSLQSPTFLYQDPGEYVAALVVKSDLGCLDTLLKKIVVGEDYGLYVPNTFTPNNDGLNDIFQPKGFGIKKYEMLIFDRWGEQIFSTTEFEVGWNGKKQSKNDVNYAICPEGVYTWKITATSVFGKAYEYTGHVTLIK